MNQIVSNDLEIIIRKNFDASFPQVYSVEKKMKKKRVVEEENTWAIGCRPKNGKPLVAQ